MIVGLSLLLGSPAAEAGACCVGATSTVPTRLGECEGWLVGLGIQGEHTVGLWDSGGAVSDAGMTDDALNATVATAWRWNRSGQLFLTAPARLTHRAAGDLDELSAGVSDVRAGVNWDPINESPATWLPVPVFTLGARLPTGTDWTESQMALQSDVTGLEGAAVVASLMAERTMGKVPWNAILDVESNGVLTATGATGSVGYYLGTRWSLVSHLQHTRTFTDAGPATAKTTAGLRVIHGRPVRWRSWAGVTTDIPLDQLGRSTTRLVTATAGLALVRGPAAL